MPERLSGSREPLGALQGHAAFAALIREESANDMSEVDALALRHDKAPLAAAVAHVFNAFGFFPAGEQPASGATAASVGQAGASRPAQALTKDALDGIQAAGVSSSDLVTTGLQSGPNAWHVPHPPRDPAALPIGSDLPRSQRQLHSVGGSAERIDLHSHKPQHVASLSIRGSQTHRTRAHCGPALGHEAVEHGQEPSVTHPVDRAVNDRGDRLIFRIGEQVVEVVGRLFDLSEDERQRLLSALGRTLESYGLSLGAATINGRPVVVGAQGAK
jgi:hypothetical protein